MAHHGNSKSKIRSWALDGISAKELAKRVFSEIRTDKVLGRAAQLAYYFLLALFPLLIFLTSAVGLILGTGSGVRHAFFQYLAQIMPSSAFNLVDATMWEVTSGSGAGKLSFGLLAALWAASNGMSAITDALNAAYDVEESRPWWKRQSIAVGLTIGLSVLIISALLLVVTGGAIADRLTGIYGLGPAFSVVWKIIQWPIALASMLLAFALIYYFAPDLRFQKWKWLTPGSIFGVVLWLLVSFGLKGYLHFFDSYNKTYGSLGAVIVLMLWLYLTGVAVLIGGEVNSEIEHAAAEHGARDAKDQGEKAPDAGPQQTKAA